MKLCEICGKQLVGKQQRFCSIRCRNVAAGRKSSPRYKLPERSELAKIYLLPPEGEGKRLEEIAEQYGVSEVTIRSWLKQHRLTQSANTRNSYFLSQPREPRIPRPPKSELAALYQMPPDGKGLTQDQLGEHYHVDRQTARRWLQFYNLLEPHSERHSKRMAGAGSHAWNGGTSRNYHKNVLKRSGQEQKCEWCGSKEKAQVHHIDHDTQNGKIDNLMWLCGYCNRLEAQLWNLSKRGRITTTWQNQNGQQTLVIQFTERSE